MQYIGETKRQLSDRFGEHRHYIEKARNTSYSRSDHFSLPDHSIKDIEHIPLELIYSDRDRIRKACEGFLIS